MSENEILFFIIKLFLGGVIAFLAILLWGRTRDFSWMFLVLAAVTGYSALVFDLLLRLGVVSSRDVLVLGIYIPLARLVLAVLPSLFVIIAFILMLIKTRRR